MRYRRVAGDRRRSAPGGEEVRLAAAIWIEEGATDREVTPGPGHPAVGQSLAAVRLSPAVAGRWPREALAGRAAGLVLQRHLKVCRCRDPVGAGSSVPGCAVMAWWPRCRIGPRGW